MELHLRKKGVALFFEGREMILNIDDVLLGLSITPTVGWKTIEHLIHTGIDESVYSLDSRGWKTKYPFLTDTQSTSLANAIKVDKISSFKEKMKKLNIGYCSFYDESYPELLKEIFNPPWILYYKGNFKLIHTYCLGVVGSRKTSSYGRSVTERLIPELVKNHWTVVSGLAYGIDTISHEVTLKTEGNTIAVLGCGIDIIYPKTNRTLYERIVDKGLIISEYPPGVRPQPAFFPLRNRIIAGISKGVIVIEAAKQSGSLITAHHALEQGKEVFAVPGSIFDTQSVGTNLLIQQHGAKLITNCQDIFDELPKVPLEHIIDAKKQRLNEGIMVEDIEKEILEVLKFEKLHINELLTKTGIQMNDLMHLLLKLEMKGFIKMFPGSYYKSIQE